MSENERPSWKLRLATYHTLPSMAEVVKRLPYWGTRVALTLLLCIKLRSDAFCIRTAPVARHSGL